MSTMNFADVIRQKFLADPELAKQIDIEKRVADVEHEVFRDLERRLAMSIAERSELREQLACSADLLNSWCREAGIAQCDDPYKNLALREAIDRLWSKWSAKHYEMRVRAERAEADVAHAVSEAKLRCPDYPWSKGTASEAVWALGESLIGVEAANRDLHEKLKTG